MKNRILKIFAICMTMMLLMNFGVDKALVQAASDTDGGKITSITRQTPQFYTCTVQTGKTLYLRPKIAPVYADNQDLKWTTSNKKIVTVTSTGKIKGIKRGTAIVRARATDGSGKYISWKVTVGTPTTKLTLNKASVSLSPGEKYKLTTKVAPANASNKTLTYSSSNKKVATVTTAGNITAVGAGQATITVWAKDGRSKASMKVVVENKVVENNRYLTSADVTGSIIAINNETYDNLYIDPSVGNIQITMYNTKVNQLVMGTGAIYTVDTTNCNINKVLVSSDQSITQKSDGIKEETYYIRSQFPQGNITPTLLAKDGTSIESIQIGASIAIQRVGTSSIKDISIVTPDTLASVIVSINGYKGNLLINAPKTETILEVTNCEIEKAEVNGALSFSDKISGTGSSLIKTLNVTATGAALTIDVPVTDLNLTSTSRNIVLMVNRAINKISNSSTNLLLFVKDAKVVALNTSGLIANINGQGYGTIETIYVDGLSTSIEMREVKPLKIVVNSYISGTIYNGQVIEAGKTVTP